MKTILYNPQSSASKKPVLPMSLLALGALLEGQRDYEIVDGNLVDDPLAVLDRAVAPHEETVLACTVMPGPQLNQAVPLCRELRRRHPQLTIVWGGYFPTQHYDACLRSGFVDFVVRGHGEEVFRNLLSRLANGEHPGDLTGLAFVRNGEAATTGMPKIPDPSELPDFPYHRVDMERYLRPTFMGKRTLPHHSSYGCPFFCNFCAVVKMVDGGWLAQSAERAAAVVERLVSQWRADAVELYDNNFFVHQGRTEEFAERIEPLRLGWWGEARIDTLLKYRERVWRRMRDSGLRMVFLGAESGSDETLRRMNKGGTATAEKTLEIAAKMKQYGIVPELSFVLGNPPDPEGDAIATMEFIRRVKRVHPGAEIILYLYTPVPLAGELYEQAVAGGFAFPETLEEWTDPRWQEVVQRRSGHLPWVGDSLHHRVRDFERVLNAYYPTVTDLRLDGLKRLLLRAASGLRYRFGFYRYPVELRVLQRLFRYQRPETAGF